MPTRRCWLLSPLLLCRSVVASAPLAALEARAGGRLGVALLNTATGELSGHRLDERFGLCSTFKLPLAACALHAVEQGRLAADARLPLRESERVPYMPVTDKLLARGWATPLELAEATQTTSDNLAANVLLRALGGPAAFTRWLRTQGDAVTRLDRYEPAMNRVAPGDARDTSSPRAFATTVGRLCSGPTLSPASRERLIAWMVATQTGQRRLRAGLPPGWRMGDKTGTGFHAGEPDRINDTAVFWPPAGAAWVLACFYEGPVKSSDWVRPEDEAVLAEVARLLSAAVATPPRHP